MRRGLIFVIILGVFPLVFVAASSASVWVEPNSFDVNTVEGTILEETLTIGNDGIGDLDFVIRTRQVGGSGEMAGESGNETVGEHVGITSAPEIHDFTVAGDAPYKSGRLIVRFAGSADSKLCSTLEKNQILGTLGGTLERNFNIVPGLSVVELPEGMTVEEALVAFNNTDGILYAEPDYEVQVCSTFPDDPRFDDLWGMHNTGQTGGTADADIDAPEAWDISTGSDEIVVAVIDTGVDYSHVDLSGNMWVNEAEYNGTPGQDDDGNGYVDDIYGYDFCNYDGDPWDDHYHGTHCAGTIGAIGDNGEGVAGVCWNVKIMAVKFLDSGGGGWTSDAILSVEYSTLMGANLSSNSWGGGGYSQGLKDAIDAAGAAGMLFVAAAGNDNDDTDIYPHYPSSYDCESLISVMATNKNDNKSSFSNYGMVSVDLGAPGSDILSCEPGNQYQYLSGTSMATPHVAGSCALLWSMDPTMSNEEVKETLLQTVDKTLSGLCVSEGRLNVHSAILETRAPWIEIEPEEGTIGPGGAVDVDVIFNALALLPGTYEAEIVIISSDPCSPEIIPVTLTVNPDDLQIVPAEGFESSGVRYGPFTPRCMTYTLTNNGSSAIGWWPTSGTESWFSVEPYGGVLDPYDSINVDVCITSEANLLDPNIYEETLIFENIDSGSIKPRSVTLTVKPPDMFTEFFDDGDSDLEGLMITFSPDGSGSYYEACREEVNGFPTDPNGGTFVPLWDDDYAEIVLNDANILFYGVRYDRFYIGSNGYITFGDGDMEFETSFENHFNMPRISGVFSDLNPPDGECISYKSLSDRVAVTFEDVPLYGDKDAKNSFQIEMFYADGTICITWLDIAANFGLAGLSEGYGLPPLFSESDLSEYVPCWPWCDLNRDYYVNFEDFAILANHWLDEDCDVPYWCGKSDIDRSGIVDYGDVSICSANWLAVEDWWLQPIAHWKLDEGEGDIAYDSAGNNNGIITGATWVSGLFGNALDFDGSGDYVDVGNDSSLNPSQITVALWFKSDDNTRGIITKGTSRGTTSQRDWDIFGTGTELQWLGSNGSSNLWRVTTAYPSTGEWHHVVGTWDGTTDPNGVKLYLDGLPVNSAAASNTNLAGTHNVYVGGYRPSGAYEFDGVIDDVRIYDRVLSAGEIWQLYEQGSGPKARQPSPANGASIVDPNVILNWQPGKYAVSHNVYFGTDYGDVNDADTSSPEYMGNFDVNSYDPCGLDLLTTYYWRIDEVGEANLWKGDVWSFKTWLGPNFIGWWEFDEGSGDTAYDSAGNNDGAITGATWVSGLFGNALDFDGSGDYVDVGNDSSLKPTLPITLSAWIRLSDLGGYEYIMALDNQASNYYGVWFFVRSDNTLGIAYGDGGYPGAVSRRSKIGTTALNTDTWYHVAAVIKGATDMDLYVNGVDDGGTYAGSGGSLVYSSGSALIGNKHDSTCPFDGIIDDVRVYDGVLSAEEIWQLYQQGLEPKASNPVPSDGAAGVDPNMILSWQPGKYAVSHDVYFGTDYGDVNDADTNSPEYMGNFDVNSYDPCTLDINTAYYWRIDEVNGPNIYKGDIWSFTTWGEFDPNFGLVSWWRLDEGEGDIAYDSAGNNDGAITGATWTSGQIDGALDFDGADDYVDCGGSPSLEPSSFTISAWIQPGNVSSTQLIAGKLGNEQADNCCYGYGLRVRYNGKANLVIDRWGCGTGNPLESTTSLQVGQWYLVTGTYDGSNAEIYINGELENSGARASDSYYPEFYIGASYSDYYSAFCDHFEGVIDDVRFYDRVLSDSEIEQLYQAGL